MASLCHFFGMAPADYWAMTIDERNGMVAYMNEYTEAQKRATRKGRRR